MGFQIVVDSCCDLTPAMMAQGVFTRVPLTLRVGNEIFVDDDGFDQAALLSQMKRCESAPQTSCPSPTDYLDAFRTDGSDIYVVTLSALLSGSHNSAQQARQIFLEEHPDANVYIFNSCSASAGEVAAAMRLLELARSGLPFEQVVAEGTRFIAKTKTLFVLESLDNLRKNGRLSRLQSVVTSTLHIKLLMGATPEGEICKRGQALSIRQALEKLVGLILADPGHKGALACIAHCNCPDRAFTVKEMVARVCQFRDILICDTAGVSTIYANDGGIVVAYG